MSNQLSKEELEEFRNTLKDLDEDTRAKLRVIAKSRWLVGLVSFVDAVFNVVSHLGRAAVWINNVLRPVLVAVGVLALIYLVATGRLDWKDLAK